MSTVTLKNIRKSYGAVEIIKGVDLQIEDGEFCVFVGPSGCGKSTLLRMIAGLEEITVGRSPDRRPAGQRRAARRARHRHGVPVLRALPAHDRGRQHGLRPAAGRRAEGRADAQGRPRPPTSCSSTRCWSASPRSFPAASASASPSAAPSSASPRSSCSTSRCPTSTPRCACRCGSSSPGCTRSSAATMIYVTHDQVEAMTMADKIVVLQGGASSRSAPRSSSTTIRATSSSPASSAARR